MSRVVRLVPSLLLPAFVLALGCKAEHQEHRGPEFHFGAAPPNTADESHGTAPVIAKQGDDPSSGAESSVAEEPGVQADGSIVSAVDWFDGTLEQALAKAKAEHKLVFVDVGAYWCPPCHELDETVFTQAKVGEWLGERMIALHIDAEKGEGPELVARYHVQAYPTLLVLEADGLEKDRIVDSLPTDALLEKLEAIAAGGNVLAELEAAAVANPDDIESRYRLGHAYALAAKREKAESVFVRVVAADPANEAGYASKVFYDRTQFLTMKLDKDPTLAIAEFEALQRKYPDSREATKAYRMIGRAHCQLDQPEQAVAALKAMVASDPEDADLKASFGWFAFRQNCRPDAGLEAVLAGIKQDPESAQLRYLEAELRRLLDESSGGGPAALAAIRKASELEPNSAYYKRQVQRFETLVD